MVSFILSYEDLFSNNLNLSTGMCCSYGSGAYFVKVDDLIVASGGAFSFLESTEFEIIFGAARPVTKSPTTVSPTPSPTPCPESEVTVEITTDNYGEETSYSIKNENGATIMEESNFESTTSYTESKCVDAGRYTFTINDVWGDG